jgi:hypothetical protein
MISLAEIWDKAGAPPDRRSIEEWASENITLPPVLTKRGKFSAVDSRHFIAPLQALRSDRVRGVRLLKPVRGGGTLIADVAAPWAIVNDNASVLWVFQDQPIAEAHAESRQMPILLSVPTIRPMLPADRHKKRKADILFANGLPFKMQGPALGGLQSRGFKWVIADEPWMWKAGILGQAKARLGDFVKNSSSKFLAISQGGEEESDWDMEVRAGVNFVWKPECAACAKPMPIEWTINCGDGTKAGIVFDTIKSEDGAYQKDETAATVRFVCPHCRHEHPNSEKTRSDWNRSGDYFNPSTGARFDPTNPPTEVTFRWHSLIDYPWAELVKEWLAAQEAKHVGNFAPLVNFFQKRCALMRSDRTIHDSDLPFARIKMDTPSAEKLPGELGRFMTGDRQSEDVYWVTVRAWFAGAETRRIWFGRLYSEADIEAKRLELGVPADCTVIDSGYKPKGDHGVYSACIRYGWIAAKGTDEPFFWHALPRRKDAPPARVQKPWAPLTWGDPGEGSSDQGRKRAPLIRFASSVMADRVMALIERGLWVEPEGDETDEIEREYRKQMSSEFKRPKVDKFTGRRVMVWVCPSGNNHAFDCSKMQVLCAMQAGLLPAGLELEKEKPKETEELKAA